MSRRGVVIGAAVGLALQAALAAGALGALPAEARITLAFAALVLLPGYAFVALGAVPPGGAWLAPGWALGFGVAWLGALVLATRALGLPFTVLVGGSLPATALLWGFAIGRGPRRVGERPAPAGARPAPPGSPAGSPAAAGEEARWSRAPLAAILVAAALGAWHAGRVGTPLGFYTDSPDHIGTIRRMMASGDAFPRDAFFRDAADAGADPRKGLWHPEVALIARLARADPLVTWRWLPACLVPLFVLNVAVLGHLLRGPPAAAVAAWALLLTYGGSFAEQFLREAGFATKLGDHLSLATAAAVLADLKRPARRLRLAAVGLALGALAAHVYYALQFAMAFAALGAGLAVADRGWSARVQRLAGTSLALGLAGLPYLAWRWSQSYAPKNIIHTQPQGLLWLFDDVRVVSVGVLWDWLGNWWILFPLAAPWLWRAGRRNPAVLYLLTTPLIVALVIFDPPAVAALEPRLGYLLMRMVWMLPLAGLLAWMVTALARAAVQGPSRLRSVLALAGMLALSASALRDAAAVLVRDPRTGEAAAHGDTTPWADALAWMDAHLPAGSVVLSDPATSYTVPMYTRHYVATLMDQHSSPNDSLALTRLMDARDALDPYAPWPRVREVVTRYGVDAIALNDRFAEPPLLMYWGPRPAWFRAVRARLDRAPAAFERVFDAGDFVVYRVHRAALDTLTTPAPPRPFVAPWIAGTSSPARQLDPALPGLCQFALSPREAAPGDTVRGEAVWRAVTPSPPGSYVVAVRFDRPLPGGFHPPVQVAKPVRKLIERLRGERYRFRADHMPVGGVFAPDLWRSDHVVRDSFELVVPRDVAAGPYLVRIRMLRNPPYANLRLSDYFLEDDYFAGLPVGPFVVRRAARAGGA